MPRGCVVYGARVRAGDTHAERLSVFAWTICLMEANVFWVIQDELEDAFLLLGSDAVLVRDLW